VLVAVAVGVGAGVLAGRDGDRRPGWLSADAARRLTQAVERFGASAESSVVTRAVVARTSRERLYALHGDARNDPRAVLVLEIWATMTLCGGGSSGDADPCVDTDGITIVHDQRTLAANEVWYGRAGVDRLDRVHELVPRKRVRVPRVVGDSLRKASEALGEAGVLWRLEGDAEPNRGQLRRAAPGRAITPRPGADLVLAQRPPAGARVDGGAVVVLKTRCTDGLRLGRRCR
jgi:hypothetical protein